MGRTRSVIYPLHTKHTVQTIKQAVSQLNSIKCKIDTSNAELHTIRDEINKSTAEFNHIRDSIAEEEIKYNSLMQSQDKLYDNVKCNLSIYRTNTCDEDTIRRLVMIKQEVSKVISELPAIFHLVCNICRINQVDTAIIPCGHTFCESCVLAYKSKEKKCMVCSKTYKTIQKIFIG